ncbi:MAG: AMP-binding protein [Bacteroidia bacterium]|nr:AMP-binding protein [Bacteroidia bacterium]
MPQPAFPTPLQIEKWYEGWKSDLLPSPPKPFSEPVRLYEETFQTKPVPPFYPLWYPDRMGNFRQTHLYEVLLELQFPVESLSFEEKGHTHPYTRLHRWSVEHRADFWAYVIQERLKVPFVQPPARILSFPSADIARPMWLEGASCNIVEMLLRHPASSLALLYEKENGEVLRWTYEELRKEVQQVAASLRAWGLHLGSRIAICMPLRPEAVFLYLAALYLGVSAVTIPDSLSGEEIATRLRIAEPQLLFIQDGLYREEKFLPLYDRLQAYKLPSTVVLAGREGYQARLRNNAITWDVFLSHGSSIEAPVFGPPDREIGLLFSSGTTAEPKAIPWTSLTALKAMADAHFYQDVHASDMLVWPTNLGWMMGPWLLFAGLGHGAAVALYEGPPTGAGFCQFVERQGVTILGVVPSLVRRWIETDAWKEADWSHIRLFSSTGEASNPWHMWQLMAKAGYKPIIEYCGGTEIGGGYITSTLLHPNAPSQFSAPALGLDFVILDEPHTPASEGELFLVPPSIGLSQTLLNADHEKVYYHDTPAVQEGWEGASGAHIPLWYGDVAMRLRRHGDYMRRLESGYWVSGGRADDAMNLGGIKVSAADIERVVAQIPGISEAAAIAVSPPEGGPEQLVLYLVLEAGQPNIPAHWHPILAQVIRERLSPLFHLYAVQIVPELPRTASNKVMRRLLRSTYLQAQQQR